jgi:hypothetical protein
MSHSYKVGQEIDYTTKEGKDIKLTVETIADSDKKYFVSGREVKKDGKLSPISGIYRLPSLNLESVEKATQSLEQQIKEQKGKDMKEIIKMAREMGGKFDIGKHNIFGGRRTRRRKRKRRRTKKKRRRRTRKKKRRRRRRKTRK